MFKTKQAFLLLSVAVLPWLLACLLTLGWAWLGGGRDVVTQNARTLFLSRQALVPLLQLLGSAGLIAVFGRRYRLRAAQWPLAGGLFASLAFLLVAVVSSTWGDGFAFGLMALWSLLSGYVALVFVFGAYAWRRMFH
ncbi:hypothetical protein [Streptomyces orinoci]|uniref:Transmembrane protein n=1 Tax=Streptomyces orinoci TaxID=67339 RepID=A0ABV3JZA3_STRON|nr:hypothetical protein [Streptomyces orinoci]